MSGSAAHPMGWTLMVDFTRLLLINENPGVDTELDSGAARPFRPRTLLVLTRIDRISRTRPYHMATAETASILDRAVPLGQSITQHRKTSFEPMSDDICCH